MLIEYGSPWISLISRFKSAAMDVGHLMQNTMIRILPDPTKNENVVENNFNVS